MQRNEFNFSEQNIYPGIEYLRDFRGVFNFISSQYQVENGYENNRDLFSSSCQYQRGVIGKYHNSILQPMNYNILNLRFISLHNSK